MGLGTLGEWNFTMSGGKREDQSRDIKICIAIAKIIAQINQHAKPELPRFGSKMPMPCAISTVVMPCIIMINPNPRQ